METKKRPEDYPEMVKFLEKNFVEYYGIDFYSDIFPDNEKSGEHVGNDYYKTPNAIYLYQDAAKRMHRRIMLKDTWSSDYTTFIKDNSMALCSGLAYRGKANTIANAQRMYALIFDLDMVGLKELLNFLKRTKFKPDQYGSYPPPTYIVASGGGIHLYYVLDEPVDLYPNIKIQLKAMKHDITYQLWDYKHTTQVEDIQYQPISQGFRMVGSINSKYGTIVRAFKTGSRISIARLNEYLINDKDKVDLLKPFRPTQLSLKEAQHKYPEWYQRRIIDGMKPGHWHIKPALYEWWKRQTGKIKGGHRYYYCMCLAIYAAKCDIPKKQLKKDMEELFPVIAAVEHENDPFTKADIKAAMEAYNKEYYRFTIDDVEKLTLIRIERNRRNGRSQKSHLVMARLVRDVVNGKQETWRDGNGRKRKNQQIYDYRQSHPDAKKADCIRDLHLSKPTVYRWWDWQPAPTVDKD